MKNMSNKNTVKHLTSVIECIEIMATTAGLLSSSQSDAANTESSEIKEVIEKIKSKIYHDPDFDLAKSIDYICNAADVIEGKGAGDATQLPFWLLTPTRLKELQSE